VVLTNSDRISRVPPYSGTQSRDFQAFAYGAFTLYGATFQTLLLTIKPGINRPLSGHPHWAPRPRRTRSVGLACSRFARRYYGNRCCFLFLRVLRCFTSPGWLPPPMYSATDDKVLTCQVSPFGNPRIKAWLAAPRGLSQLPTSFFASCCLGIHHAPLVAWSHNPSPSSPSASRSERCDEQDRDRGPGRLMSDQTSTNVILKDETSSRRSC
jgi:hypothetical protein